VPGPSCVAVESAASLRFGAVELQPAERRLLVHGQPVSIGARAFDLLAALATRPGRLVTKNELLDLVWPGLVVEESNLHTQMSTLRKLLGVDVIATVPGRGYRFAAGVQPADGTGAMPPPAPSAVQSSAPGSGLPASGSRLIGRDADLAQLLPALGQPGCVTLVGAGGVGKTRLALAAAQCWDGRCVWVDLAPLTDGAQIAGALARAAGFSLADGDAGALVRGLGSGAALLVLDNAEHLVDAAAALVASLWAAAPQLRWLVTSQLPLAIAGERVHRIEPLAIEAGPASGDGAVALLAERIVAADHRMRLEAASTPLLRDICRQLDGLPLALEMAAARVPLLGLGGVRDELAQRFALLTSGHRHAALRHRSLHAALDWSYNLLGAEERQLFAALGVFAGGFTLELCVALAGDGASSRWQVIDRLAVLVDRSLVVVSSDDPPRYRLLETLRAYALEKLRDSGTEQAMRGRHAGALVDLFAKLPVDDTSDVLCLAELDNMREGFNWARIHAPLQAATASRLAAARASFSPWRAEVFSWLKSLEPLMRSPQAESFDLESRVLWWIEFARNALMDMSENALEVAREALALARILGQPESLFLATVVFVRSSRALGPEVDAACADLVSLGQAHPEWPARKRLVGLGTLALVAARRGDHEAELAARRQELAVAREAGRQTAVDAAETNVVGALNKLGRHEEALGIARGLVQRLDGRHSANLAWAWDGLLTALLSLGRTAQACESLRTAVAACAEFNLPIFKPQLARLAWLRQRPEAAAQLLGHALQDFHRRGIATDDFEQIESISAEAQRLLGVDMFRALVEQGRSLDEAGSLELACGEGGL
jgi:predicted ATPase/DNA-binding winged helix-turn-helix (wHTH) protein